MKRCLLSVFLAFLIGALLVGCAVPQGEGNDDGAEDSSGEGGKENHEGGSVSDDFSQIFKDEIRIYEISSLSIMDDFYENDLLSILENHCSDVFTWPQDGMLYVDYPYLYPLTDSFLTLFSSQDNVEAYLAKNDSEGTLLSMAIYTAPFHPMTAWLKTTVGNFYVTICEQEEDEDDTYRLYTENEYEAYYAGKAGTLVVEGRTVDVTHEIVIYRNNALLPLYEVFLALDLDMRRDGDNVYISAPSGRYTLHLKSGSLTDVFGTDHLLLGGGDTFLALVEDDIMVDDWTLQAALYDMGLAVEIEIAPLAKTVAINKT